MAFLQFSLEANDLDYSAFESWGSQRFRMDARLPKMPQLAQASLIRALFSCREGIVLIQDMDTPINEVQMLYESFRVTLMSEFAPYVPPPEALRVWIEQHPRVDAIDNHGFDLNLGWWNSRISESHGAPVTSRAGETGQGFISRGDIFDLAQAAREDESGISAVRLFWHTLAWGTGSSHRNSPRRIESVAGNEKVRHLLRRAAGLSMTDPHGAFLLLKPGRNAISSLGPNFFTKFLYFTGGGALEHPSLIVDNRVLRSLHRETERPLLDPDQPTNYGPAVYEDALLVMKAWAEELSHSARIVGADEVERWAFATGRRP